VLKCEARHARRANYLKQDFKIHGMDCAEEVDALKRELRPLVGDESLLSFDILKGRMTLHVGPDAVPPESILRLVGHTGMRAEPWNERVTHAGKGVKRERRLRMLLTTMSGVFGLLGFLVHVKTAGSVHGALGSEGMGLGHAVPVVAELLYALGILSGGRYVFPKAWLSLRRLRPDMNLLMTLAVLGAMVIGEWFEAATVTFLFALSLTLESWSVARARRAVESLLAIAPATVRVPREDGTQLEVPASEVQVGTVFLVKPGDRIALDGIVVRGASEVNQAPITGESLPVAKSRGADVFAGTINGNGALEVQSTKPADKTILAHIIRIVGEAQKHRAASEQWVERFARIYTPVVLGTALFVAAVPPLVFSAAWSVWVYRALVLLVIGCPCALVISTPVSVVAALTAAAKHGVLIKGGLHVETPAKVRAMAFDKTGTLTLGKPGVTEVVPLNGHTETEILERMVSMESHSEHPLARAIVAFGKDRGVRPVPVEDFEAQQGKGVKAILNGTEFWLGSHRYLEERGQETPEVRATLEKLSRSGRTVVVLGNERHACGFVALADRVRPDAVECVRALRQCGIHHIVMLTGDHRATAESIAREVGVDDIRAELLPAEKVQAVEALVEEFGCVAMVGDGINDAPALARSNLGIAMGAAGSDAAIEAADVALMSDDLSKLPWLIQHSKRALAIIRQNIGLSLFVKVVFVVLTFAGLASLWAAIAADMGVSLLVIFNALRLLKARAN
jgi:Cd2+/Zn2+-exporting ATPase